MGYDLEPGITQADVEKALHGTKNSNSSGADDIPIELIKSAGEEGARVMTALCQKVKQTGIWPADWKKSIYISIPMKRNIRICANEK